MIFVRLLSLIAAVLVLAGADRRPEPALSVFSHSDAAFLQMADQQVAKKAIASNTLSSPVDLPVLLLQVAPELPAPTCHPAAECRGVVPKLKHAYASQFSGLSPPFAA